MDEARIADEREEEERHLDYVLSLIDSHLAQATRANESTGEEIDALRKEVRENATHSVSNLYNPDNFEDLVELSAMIEPITTKVAVYDSVSAKIASLEKARKTPYFARVDFTFDNETEREALYIGRTSIDGQGIADIAVYDWRAPIASLFYRFLTGPAYFDAPAGRLTGTIGLKRQYEIRDGTLDYFFDADVQIADEFLRRLLSQNTSPRMKTIVETIQSEQDIVIRDMESDVLIVQGTAGSGKTSIALHRIAYLMYSGLVSRLRSQNILVISPNALFGEYIANVLPELGEENTQRAVIDDIFEALLSRGSIQYRNRFYERQLTASSRRARLMRESLEFKTSSSFKAILDRLLVTCALDWLELLDIAYAGETIMEAEKMRAHLASMPAGVPLYEKLRRMAESIEDDALVIRNRNKREASREEYVKIRERARAMASPSIMGFYRRLWEDKTAFDTLSEGIDLPENIDEIRSMTLAGFQDPYLPFDDASAAAYLTLKAKGPDGYANAFGQIRQVVIDEAQDYYPLHFETFNALFSGARFTILGDVNQTVAKLEDLGFFAEVSRIMGRAKTRTAVLNKSFRSTVEILDFAARLIPSKGGIESFNRSGEEPVFKVFEGMEDLADAAVLEAIDCLEEQGFNSVGLLCKTARDARGHFKLMEGLFAKRARSLSLIASESSAPLSGALLVPTYLSKGLEFDAVIVIDADDVNYRTQEDAQLLYIAATRALHRLFVFAVNTMSPLIPADCLQAR